MSPLGISPVPGLMGQSLSRGLNKPAVESATNTSTETKGANSPSTALTLANGATRTAVGLGNVTQNLHVNPINGTLSLSIPLYTTPARAGLQPLLTLTYDSGAGNGPFGVGWSLGQQCISRQTSHHIPKYDETDTFVMSGAPDELVSVSGEEAAPAPYHHVVRRFRPRTEDYSARIECWTHTEQPDNVHAYIPRAALRISMV
jgi:hypothetical protein